MPPLAQIRCGGARPLIILLYFHLTLSPSHLQVLLQQCPLSTLVFKMCGFSLILCSGLHISLTLCTFISDSFEFFFNHAFFTENTPPLSCTLLIWGLFYTFETVLNKDAPIKTHHVSLWFMASSTF